MPDEVRERAIRLESLIPRLMRALFRPSSDDPLSQLPVAQMRIMRVLYSDNRTVTSLGEELVLTPSAVTQMINRLQDAGFVMRVEDAEDRRVKHLGLTQRGRELMRSRQALRVSRAQELLAKLSDARQRDVLDLFAELIAAGGEHPALEPLSHVADLERRMPLAPPYKP